MIGRLLFGVVDAGLCVLEAGVRTYERGKRLARVLLRRSEPFSLRHPRPPRG